MIRNALHAVNELGVLFTESIKLRSKFEDICSQSGGVSPTKLRPLCPTRWTVRLQAVSAVLDQYPEVLGALQETSESQGHVAARAHGLLQIFSKSSTYVALGLSRSVLEPLQKATVKAQRTTCTVTELVEMVDATISVFQTLRDNADERIETLLKKASSVSLEAPETPRMKKPPKRFTGPASAYQAQSPEEWLRTEYLAFLDTASAGLRERFKGDGIAKYKVLESLVLQETPQSRCVEDARRCMDQWPPELDEGLASELQVFLRDRRFQSLPEVVSAFRELNGGARSLLPNVERLLRLLLVLPASSATAERSFSSLRRLKTWLRSRMTQRRLNDVAVLHVHKDRAANVNPRAVAAEFVALNPTRASTFGKM